ncbi:MAG: GGDEF domain-containing protein [Gammaproteobacteria bacterium]|nr:GGDEF domain-containing protein [Gammaproteobacteria bacterium]
MPVAASAELITFIGVVTQMTAFALLSIVFLLLTRLSDRREYFQAWVVAWIFYTAALVVLVPAIANGRIVETLSFSNGGAWIALSVSCYVMFKLMTLTALLAGILQFCRHFSLKPYLVWMTPGIVVYTVITLSSARNALDVASWLAIPTVAVATYSAWLLWRLPRPRRTLGTRTACAALAMFAVAWALYLPAFSHVAAEPWHDHGGWRLVITQYNGFIDTFIGILLAIGMILIVLEDTLLEVRAAYRELTSTHEELRKESYVDPLTGALNRRAFDDGFGLDTALAAFGTVAMLDLDDLKPVNDKFGHEAGDRLLVWVVTALRSNLRPTDKLYRWGGDEFLLVLPRAAAEATVHRLREILGSIPPRPVVPGGQPQTPAVSIGAAEFTSGEAVDDAVQLADERMYLDKRQRKGLLKSGETQRKRAQKPANL